MLHLVVLDAAVLVRRLRRLDDDEVLDPDTERLVAGLVIVPRLVREDLRRLELDVVVRDTRADAHRALVDVQEVADAVAGAVSVVEAVLPERPAGPRVEQEAGGALGEDSRVDRDVALQDAGVRPLLERCRRTVMEGTGDAMTEAEVSRRRVIARQGSRAHSVVPSLNWAPLSQR